MTIEDWQLLISIILGVVTAAVGATAWIVWRLSKANTEIKHLKDNVKKTEDLIMYMLKLDYEEGRKVAFDLMRDSLSKKEKQEEKKD